MLAATVDPVLAHYEKHESKHLVPMLSEVIRFSTHQYDPEAHVACEVVATTEDHAVPRPGWCAPRTCSLS